MGKLQETLLPCVIQSLSFHALENILEMEEC